MPCLTTDSLTYQNALLKIQKAVLEDSVDLVATLEMYDSVRIHLPSADRRAKMAKINSIRLRAHDGVLTEIIVNTDSGIFRNKNAVIDLVHMDSRGGDKLFFERQRYYSSSKSRFIYLDDVLCYSPARSYSDIPYADFEATLLPDLKNRHYYIT